MNTAIAGLTRLASTRALGLALALALAGCGYQPTDAEFRSKEAPITEDENATFVVSMPTSVSQGASVVAAAGWLRLGDRTKIIAEANSGVATTTGGGVLEVGHDGKPRTLVANANSILRDRVKVDGNLVVEGQATIGNQVQVYGTNSLNTQVDVQPAFELPVYIPDELGGNVMVEPDLHVTLPPAKYGTVSVKSRSSIRLSAGTYEFSTLHVAEPQSKIVVDDGAGPVIVYVKTNFTYRGAIQSVSGAFPRLLFVYLGTQDLWIEAPFQGHLFAPQSTSHLRPTSGPFTGSFWGKNVDTNPDTNLVHKPFLLADFFHTDVAIDDTPYIIGQTTPVRLDPDADPWLPTPVTGVTPITDGSEHFTECASELVAEFASADPSTVEALRYLTPAERSSLTGCVRDYQECSVGTNGTLGSPTTPSEAELNAVPTEPTTCAASDAMTVAYENPDGLVDSVELCGVETSVLDLPEAERPVCTTDADCASNEVCSRFCPAGDCEESEFSYYCAARRTTCDPLPELENCVERSVCPFENYTGEAYDEEAAADQNTPVTEIPPEALLPDQPQPLAPYTRPACTPVAVDGVGSEDLSEPPQDSGNSDWGIEFKPTVEYGYTTPTSPLGLDEELDVWARAGFAVDAKVWGMAVPVFLADVNGRIGPDELTLNRSTKLFGQEIDLTGNVDLSSIPENISDAASIVARQQMNQVSNAFADAQLAFSHLLRMRDYLATNNLSAPADAKSFCEVAVDVLGDVMGGGNYSNVRWCSPAQFCPSQLACPDISCPCGPGEVPETVAQAQARAEQAVDDAIEGWRKNYEEAMAVLDWDPEAAVQGAIAGVKDQIPGSNPDLADAIPLEAGRHRFAAFSLAFTFPVGPVPVTMEIELAGSWALDAELELEGSFENDPFARAGTAMVPGMDVQVLAFAGINLGFAAVGIGGELTLIEIEIPLRGGAEVMGEKIQDTRPLVIDIGGGQQQAIANDYASRITRLATTRWNAGFYYGAGMHTEVLAGNINLQARINLFFFSVSFKQILAQWAGIPFDFAFVGSIHPVQGLQLPEEALAVVDELTAAGEDIANLKALVPLSAEGFAGNVGAMLPLLEEAALDQLPWPPSVTGPSGSVSLPTTGSLCGTPDIIVK